MLKILRGYCKPSVHTLLFALLFLFLSTSLFSEGIIKSDDPAIQDFLQNHTRIDPEEAQGKIIHEYTIVRYPVIMPSDIWPEFLNKIHVVTREQIIRGYLELEEGKTFDKRLMDESARNLLRTGNIADVAYYIREHTENSIDILVITRDIWSLKIPTDPIWGGGEGVIEIAEQETNFLGLNKLISLDQVFRVYRIYDAATDSYPSKFGFSFGATFSDRHFLNTPLILYAKTLFHIDHRPAFQGAEAKIGLYRPLYSILEKWGGGGSISYINTTVYPVDLYYIDIEVTDPTGDSGDTLAEVYHAQSLSAHTYITRSWGDDFKIDLTPGIYFMLSLFDTVENYSGLIPVDRKYWELYVSADFFKLDYHTLKNIYTFGVDEHVPTGFYIHSGIHHSDTLLGSDRTETYYSLWGLYQLLYWKEAMLRISASLAFKITNNNYINPERKFSFNIRQFFPVLGIGRFAVQMGYIQTLSSQSRLKLGGNRSVHYTDEAYAMNLTNMYILRGYPSQYFQGYRILFGNIEYRSLPIYLLSTHFSAVLFMDIGCPSLNRSDIFRYGDDIFQNTFLTSGFGIQILFPQFNQANLRIDFGLPLNPPSDYDYFNRSTFFNDLIEKFTLGFYQTF